jgi:hypothetical protein
MPGGRRSARRPDRHLAKDETTQVVERAHLDNFLVRDAMPNKSSVKKTTSVIARESKPRSSISRVLPGSSASGAAERRGMKSSRIANITGSSPAGSPRPGTGGRRSGPRRAGV